MLPPNVERFLIRNGVKYHTVPFKQCPQCSRTMTLVGVAATGNWDGEVLFHFRCPVHLQDYAATSDDGTTTP